MFLEAHLDQDPLDSSRTASRATRRTILVELQAGSYHSEKDGAFSNTAPPLRFPSAESPGEITPHGPPGDRRRAEAEPKGRKEKKKKRKRDAHPFIMVIEE